MCGLDVSEHVRDTSIIVLWGLLRVAVDDDGGDCCVSFGLWAKGLNVSSVIAHAQAGQGREGLFSGSCEVQLCFLHKFIRHI